MMAMDADLLRLKSANWFLGAIFLLGGLVTRPPAHAAERDSPFPVRVSANHRYLEDSTGKPFLLHGDTAWSILVQLKKEEAEEYLENRRRKGFNSIVVNLLEYYYATSPPKNVYGDGPFTTPGDFSTPNEAYFAHADRVLSSGAEKGILVLLNPCYQGFTSSGTTDGWYRELLANGPANCRNYGRYLGNRYRNYKNIVWVAGGDSAPLAGSDKEKNW